MKMLAVALLVSSPAFAADGFATVDEYQSDFESAVRCKPVEGRKVWKGKDVFYIQSKLFSQSDALSDDAANTVIPAENTPQVMKQFEQACEGSE